MILQFDIINGIYITKNLHDYEDENVIVEIIDEDDFVTRAISNKTPSTFDENKITAARVSRKGVKKIIDAGYGVHTRPGGQLLKI